MTVDRSLSDAPYPGLGKLLDAAEPWRPIEEVAGQLLSVWKSAFDLTSCGLVWQDAATRQTVYAMLPAARGEISSSAELHEEAGFPGGNRLDVVRVDGFFDVDSADSIASLPEPFCRFTWTQLSQGPAEFLDGDPLIGLLPQEASPRIDEEWQRTTLLLFRWAARYREELRSQKLSALVEYAAGAGHEINNPLGSIIGRASQLLKAEVDPEKRRTLESIGAQAYRIRDMIGDTMLFANPPPLRRQRVDLCESLQLVLSKFAEELRARSAKIEFDTVEPLCISADPDQVKIVMAEALRNTLRAWEELPPEAQRTLKLQLSRAPREGRAGVLLEVIDNGPGFTAEQAEHCFDPFYSGRQAGRGLGFGLSKCWRILQLHQGQIHISSDVRQTILRVWWPESAVSTASSSAANDSIPPHSA